MKIGANPNCDQPFCNGTGEIEMGWLKRTQQLWFAPCPKCFPDTVYRHPEHHTIRFGDGMPEPEPDPGERQAA